MLTVTLYTKDPCPLCDEVKAMLDTVRPTYPHVLQEIDITADQELFFKYRYIIPVVTIGEQTLKAPITLFQLTAALRQHGRL